MSTSSPKKTILITGCSDGGLGSELCLAFHAAGYRVFATARNTSKLAVTSAARIESLELDPTSTDSIKECVAEVAKLTGGSLDVLLNNAGMTYQLPILDMDLSEVRRMFDVNTFAIIPMVQNFVPLLEKSAHGGLIVTNTSIASVLPLPIASMYAASKAATAFLMDALRMEIQPFGIRVVELKTGGVKSRILDNQTTVTLPPTSRYLPVKEDIEKTIAGDAVRPHFVDAADWAKQVVRDLNRPNPPNYVWRGYSVLLARIAEWVPRTWMDGAKLSTSGLGNMQRKLAVKKHQ